MPQTPSFLIPRGLALYNLLVGQCLSLRSGRRRPKPPVRRPSESLMQTVHDDDCMFTSSAMHPRAALSLTLGLSPMAGLIAI